MTTEIQNIQENPQTAHPDAGEQEAQADARMIAFADALALAQTDFGTGDNQRSHGLVAEWATQHPEQGAEFARYAASVWLQVQSSAVDADEVRELTRRTLAALPRHVRPVLEDAAQPPLQNLLEAAKARDLTVDALAESLQLSVALLTKLNRRLMNVATLPVSLVQELADTIGRGTDEVWSYLSQPPRLALNARYRADTAPMVGTQEDWQAAVASDTDLTDAQRTAQQMHWQAEE